MRLKLLLVCLLVSTSLTARAADELCPVIAGGSAELADIPVGERLAFVQARLNIDAHRARISMWTWLALYSGSAIGNGVNWATQKTYAGKVDGAVGTLGSLLGIAFTGIAPPGVVRDQHKLAKLVASYETRDHCQVLAEAEQILLRDARSEAFGRGPLVHAGSFGFNAALAILVGTGFGHWSTADILAPVAIVISEIQQLSVRTHIDDTLKHYRAGELTIETAPIRPAWSLSPQLGHGQYGVGFGLTF